MTVTAQPIVTAERESALLASVPTGLLIDGQWRPAASGKTFDVEDPSTGKVLLSIADAGPEDGAAALDAAAAAQESWAKVPPRERGEILRRAFELVTERAEDFALLMTLEMGKPLAEARGEVTYGAEFLRWFSEEAVRAFGRYSVSPDGKSRLLVTKKPVGPCLLITPWNFPLAMATRKIAPAVAAGCTMVLKSANLTPLTSQLFAAVMLEAGLPAGVLNVIPTSTAGATTGPLIKDSRLRKLSFTGSTEVGRRLLSDASETVLRTSMELGGNAPFVVFEDADVDAAVAGAMLAKLRNMGEACTAANRFIVHESVADEFAEKFAAKMADMTTARGTEAESKVGPLIDAKSRDKVHELVIRRRVRRRGRGDRRRRRGRSRATSTSPPSSRASPRAPGSCPRRSSGPSRRSSPSTPRTRRSGWRTTPSTGWSPTSLRGTSTGASGWANAWRPACWA